MESTEQFDQIFNEIQNMSYNFVKELNKGEVKNFNELFNKYIKRIEEFGEKIPTLLKNIREFEIY